MQNTEYMFVFSKGKPKTVNLIRDRKNRWAGVSHMPNSHRKSDGTIKKAQKVVTVSEYGKRNNWWLMPRPVNEPRQYKVNHPAVFPFQLAHDHILSWSNAGDTVLDPFMGSGTTGLACLETGRKFVGIEISEEYFNLARGRIEQDAGQMRISDPDHAG